MFLQKQGLGDMADKQGIVEEIPPAAATSTGTAREILLRITRWQVLIDKRLNSQMTVLEAMEYFALAELRMHFPLGNIDAGFIVALLDAVLQKLIDGKPVMFLAIRDAPFRWPGGSDPALPARRREAVIQTVDNVSLYFLDQYKRYLQEHWETKRQEPLFDRLVKRKLQRYIDDIDALFQADRLAGLTLDRLRRQVEKLEARGTRRYRLTALATGAEKKILEAQSFAQLPHWLRVLNEPDRTRLRDYQEQTSLAQAALDDLLDGCGSLRAYARQQAIDYIQLKLDMEVEPDRIDVRLKWRAAVGEPTHNCSLSELLAAGPIGEDFATVLEVTSAPSLRNQPMEPAFIADMLAEQDYPADYLRVLARQYEHEEVRRASSDWIGARLKHSAFVARCAGHLAVVDHDRLVQTWAENTGDKTLRVAALALPNGMQCADLLVFYREEATQAVADLVLYAPNKPDGQEWVRLSSLAALTGEVWGWTQHESGREYLLQQLSPTAHRTAREYLVAVSANPALWGMNSDIRRTAKPFAECVEAAANMGLAKHLQQVEEDNSLRCYSTLAPDARRRVSSLNQELVVHQRVFNELLGGFEVFVDFARRTVAAAIAPYMRSKNVQEAVDPATVLIDYNPGVVDRTQQSVASLLDLAIYGYDDNAGIDHPQKGVRSSVGQDLSQVRSADLALYLRRAWLGEKYASEIRDKYLDSRDPAYEPRRFAYRNVLLSKMDRDLRVARSQSRLSDAVYFSLVRQVSLLSQLPTPGVRLPGASVVVDDGVFRFTVRGHVVLGVYVFVCHDPEPCWWLYTPDAPDSLALRPYQSLLGDIAGTLHDYLMARTAVAARKSVSRTLQAIAAKNQRVDTLYEAQRVSDARSEFNAYIERAVTDVEDITTSRAEMIERQVVKGLMFGAAPFCMVFPPFALLLDVVFIAVSVGQAVEAHLEGDVDGALGHWLEASWGALFAMVSARSTLKLLGHTVRSLKHTIRPASALAERLQAMTPIRKETLPAVREVRFHARQAVSKTPEHLQRVTDEGVFFGTWRSPPSAAQPQPTYYIRSRGKYFQVRENPHFGGLSLIDARRPAAIYQRPIRLTAGGKWTHERVGLRGGNDQVRNLGQVSNLRDAFPGRVEPVLNRGAMQGEVVVAKFVAGSTDNYLYSLNAQSCVIASLYNPLTKIGAVIHFDHNIRALIERTVKDVLTRLGGSAKNVRATLVGGDWLTGTDIGGPIRRILRQQGLRPTWDYWSYSSCLGNNYAVSLNLKNGVSTVFKTSARQVERLYTPLLQRARYAKDPVSRRAASVLQRVRSKPLYENAAGNVVDQTGHQASAAMVEEQAFSTVLMN
ncbi:Type III effector 1 [Pseudomonas sp. IT-347P]|uniref:type III effector 1 n=1 Tax=Pseudomonas sp. IT-347P TaxID=3026458 RepID=UPI0039DFB5DF